MRTQRLAAGLTLGLLLAPIALAQQVPYETTIAAPEVEVRSGPSPKFYPTGKLRVGERVRVVEEKDGWLAITPPPGSFSWIVDRLVERHGRTAVVVTEAPVRIGSAISNAPPVVEQVKLPRGAQVIVMGDAYTPPGEEMAGKWWPIAPPPQEVRYIPKEAVKITAPVEATAQSSPVGALPGTPGQTWPTAPGAAPNALWAQAEEAERTGNVPRAIEIYTQLARQVIDSDHALAMRCFNRIQFLRDGRGGSVPPGYQYRPQEASTAVPDNRVAPVPAGTAVPPAAATQAGYAPAQPGGMQTSGPGRLRRAGFFVDGKQAYVLENSQGRPQLYVTGQGALNLEPYVNKAVELYGPVAYRGDLRTNYMTAAHLVVLPQQ